MLTERSVELPWLVSHIGRPKHLLDIGSADSAYISILFELCRDLYLCDTRKVTSFVPATIFRGSAHKLPEEWTAKFDLVTMVSVLDHIGLGAYGNEEDIDLVDLVLCQIERVLKPQGRLLLTVPIGHYSVTLHPMGGQRVFDYDTLISLFPKPDWELASLATWRLCGENYERVLVEEVKDARYLEWRAEACIALEMVRQ